MTFRTVLTSASDVDTRLSPAGAGVRVYTDNSDPSHPRGVIELSDGWFGDVPATLSQHSTANPRAENASGAGGITLAGGTYGGGAAPSLDLDVIQGADVGLWVRRARLSGFDTLDLGLAAAQLYATAVQSFSVANWQTLTLGGASQDTAGGWSATVSGAKGPDRYVIQAAGDYTVEGIAAIGSIPAGAYAGARILVNGAAPSGSPGQIEPTGAIAGSTSKLTGRKRYTLAAGDVVQLQAFTDRTSWSTRMTSTSDGITSQLLIERVT